MNEPMKKAKAFNAVHGGQDVHGAQMMSSDDHSEAKTSPSETGLSHSPFSPHRKQGSAEKFVEIPPKKRSTSTMVIYALCALAQVIFFIIGIIIGYMVL